MFKLKKFMSSIAIMTAASLIFTASADAKQYTVKRGDTLYSIAKRNGTTVAQIVRDNRLVKGSIKPGQVLNVGSSSTKTTKQTSKATKTTVASAGAGYHRVTKGDTLYSIARKNGLSLAELKKINNLSSNYVAIGTVLKVSKSGVAAKPVATTTTKKVVTTSKTPVTTKAPKTTKVPSVNAGKGQHKVVKGDTLYSIARKNGLSVAELKKLNNLSSNSVAIGTVLKVSKSVPKPVTVTTTKKTTAKPAVTTKKPTPKPVAATTTKKKETAKPKPADATTTKKVTTTTKKTTAKPKPVTTTKKVANVPGATFKDKADQELWNKVANNYKKDPSVRGLNPRVAQMKQYLGTKFGVKDFSLYRPGDNDGTGHGHGDGLALDLMVPVGGKKGDDISNYLVKNYSDMGIYYLIWKQRFYMDQNNIYGPANRWNLMPDRGGITANHYDHVHISFKK